jgi:hypothetical protein
MRTPLTMIGSIASGLLLALFLGTTITAVARDYTPPEIVRYLKTQGPIIDYRLFPSEASDQVVIQFCVDENLEGGANEGASNPANVHCEVVLFNRKAKWVLGNQLSIGQGSIREFANGRVRGESITYAPEDPLCCPSKKREVVFSTEGGKLVAVPQ